MILICISDLLILVFESVMRKDRARLQHGNKLNAGQQRELMPELSILRETAAISWLLSGYLTL